MKSVLTVFILCLPIFCHAQKMDTTITKLDSVYKVVIMEFYPFGELQKIIFQTREKVLFDEHGNPRLLTEEERFDLFMRNYPINEIIGKVVEDSLKVFHESGLLQHKKIGNPEQHWFYHYDKDGKLSHIEKRQEEQYIYIDEDQVLEVDQYHIQVEGKIGEEQWGKLELRNTAKQALALTFKTTDVANSLDRQSIQLLVGETDTLLLKVQIAAPASRSTLQILRDMEPILTLPISVNGYDLSEEDFTPESSAQALSFTNRKSLFLQIDNKEKLLKIYRNGVQLVHSPISQIKNEIDMQSLKPGEYRFEITDLGSQEKRYCKVLLQ